MSDSFYTVGHSIHDIDKFIRLIAQHGIMALCDVRSSPYSRMNPQFDRESIKQALLGHGIGYVFLGKEFGARSNDPSCYVSGKVQYDRLAKTALFASGLERVRDKEWIEEAYAIQSKRIAHEEASADAHQAPVLNDSAT